MSKRNRIRHKLRCFIGCITEHHTLITCADCFQFCIGHFIFLCFQCFVNAHGNVRRLLIYGYQYCTGISVKSICGFVIPDLFYGVTNHFLYIYISACGNLACYQHKSCTCSSFAGHTAHRILLHAGIQNRI